MPEYSPQQINEKRRRFTAAEHEAKRFRLPQAPDAYIAAFLVPKTKQGAEAPERGSGCRGKAISLRQTADSDLEISGAASYQSAFFHGCSTEKLAQRERGTRSLRSVPMSRLSVYSRRTSAMGPVIQESAAGNFPAFIATAFNSFDRFCRKTFLVLGARSGICGALTALLVALGAIPTAAQSVQFFGAFQSYQQNAAQNAQGLVATAQGNLYISGSHALGYIPVDVNGTPQTGSEHSFSGCYRTNGDVMGMAIDASGNIFRADAVNAVSGSARPGTWSCSPSRTTSTIAASLS